MSLLKTKITATTAWFTWIGSSPQEYDVRITPFCFSILVVKNNRFIFISNLEQCTSYNLTVTWEGGYIEREFRTVLSPPSICDVPSHNSIILLFDSPVIAKTGAKIVVEYNINNEGLENKDVQGRAFKIDNLKLGDVCSVKARIVYDGNASDWTKERVTRTVVPIPTNIKVENCGTGKVQVTWDPVLREMNSTYEVKVCENRYFRSKMISVSEKTESASIIGLRCNKTYKVSVKAIVKDFSSEWSEPVQITTDKLTVPTNVFCKRITDSTATFSWGGVEDETVDYEVQYWKKSNFFIESFAKGTIEKSSTNTVMLRGLCQDTTYRCKVRTIFGEDQSDWTDINEFETQGPPAPKRQKLSQTNK